MGMPLNVESAGLFIVLYLAVFANNYFSNRREFKQHPDKARRYQALPLRYKLACRVIVMPLFAATVFLLWAGLFALIAMFLLEAACMRWYRQHGLL